MSLNELFYARTRENWLSEIKVKDESSCNLMFQFDKSSGKVQDKLFFETLSRWLIVSFKIVAELENHSSSIEF